MQCWRANRTVPEGRTMSWKSKLRGDKPLLKQHELGPRLGGLKVLFQRSGIVMHAITMVSAMGSFWATSPALRAIFRGYVGIYYGAAAFGIFVWILFYYKWVLPSEQTFNQVQSQRPERSPLKRDTEAILEYLEQSESSQEQVKVRADGGE